MRQGDVTRAGTTLSGHCRQPAALIVPTLRVGTRPVTLCVTEADAERPGAHSHAERGSEHKSWIARKGIESKDRLGRYRWVVERTHAWLAAMDKLRTRFERRLDIHPALLCLGCCVICIRQLTRF